MHSADQHVCLGGLGGAQTLTPDPQDVVHHAAIMMQWTSQPCNASSHVMQLVKTSMSLLVLLLTVPLAAVQS